MAAGMQVGIIGGTGPAGRALAVRLAASGASVLLGSRSAERADGAAGELRASWPDHPLELTGVTNEVAARAEIVVLATPWDGAVAPPSPSSPTPSTDGSSSRW